MSNLLIQLGGNQERFVVPVGGREISRTSPPYRSAYPRETQVLEMMKNVDMVVEKNILTIRVDLEKEFGASKSGKSITIASTEGNVSVPGHEGIKIGLNIYRAK